jgi:hypothetical protein
MVRNGYTHGYGIPAGSPLLAAVPAVVKRNSLYLSSLHPRTEIGCQADAPPVDLEFFPYRLAVLVDRFGREVEIVGDSLVGRPWETLRGRPPLVNGDVVGDLESDYTPRGFRIQDRSRPAPRHARVVA